jgi:hypothetical protein
MILEDIVNTSEAFCALAGKGFMAKECTKCHVRLPLSCFLQRPDCRECVSLQKKNRWEEKRKARPDYVEKRVLPLGVKICCKCKRDLSFSDFHFTKGTNDGRQGVCKECRANKSEAEKKNKTSYDKFRYESKKPEILGKCHLYYEANKPEVLLKQKKYNQEHRPEKAETDRAYRLSHPESVSKKKKDWYSKNKKRVSARYKERYWTDPMYRFTVNARTRYGHVLRNMTNGEKVGSAVEALRCTPEEFKSYFGNKLAKRGWTWKQQGRFGWHYDHIVPLSAFDLTNREQFLQAFHYTNLQPLWWDENLRKGSKIE